MTELNLNDMIDQVLDGADPDRIVEGMAIQALRGTLGQKATGPGSAALASLVLQNPVAKKAMAAAAIAPLAAYAVGRRTGKKRERERLIGVDDPEAEVRLKKRYGRKEKRKEDPGDYHIPLAASHDFSANLTEGTVYVRSNPRR